MAHSHTGPVTVVVTGAAGQIAYSLLFSIAKGDVFGKDQKIILKLLDIQPMQSVLDGVVMELSDCAFPLLQEVHATYEETVFKGAQVAMLVGAMPRREGMLRKDLLSANVKIFKAQGQAIDKYADKNIKVVVVGNPANTNALICQKYAPSIPPQNFTCLTRLDQNRSQAQIAARLGVSPEDVKNVIIWGNHSATQYPDVSKATVNLNGQTLNVYDAIKDDNYLKNAFIKTVQQRGAAVIKARKLSSAMSAAKATGDHVRDWMFGTAEGEWVSMGVCSDGSYDIPEGLIYSFPVYINKDHTYTIVQGLKLSEFDREKMDLTCKELIEERDTAFQVCEGD